LKTAGQTSRYLAGVADYVLWFAKDAERLKIHHPLKEKTLSDDVSGVYRCVFDENLRVQRLDELALSDYVKANGDYGIFRLDNITSQSVGRAKGEGAASWFPVQIDGREIRPSIKVRWKTNETGMYRLLKAKRVNAAANSLTYIRFLKDFRASDIGNVWTDMGTGNFTEEKAYVVQTSTKVVQRCLLMASDPGDLILDPTCGSGTSAYVAEQWGRRWITIDTSRVALALARTRLMAARYPWYLLADSREGRTKEAELTQRVQANTPTHDDIRQGFINERVPRITLRSIASNPQIDDIWEKWHAVLERLRASLNAALGKSYEEWQIPRDLLSGAPASAKEPHAKWWEARIARQREIDASIAARADVEYLYDKPYVDTARVRVAGPFTVESLSPHRVLPASEEELIDEIKAAEGRRSPADADLAGQDFAAIVIDYLKSEGVKQQAKGDRITFESLTPWPGAFIGASGTFVEGENGPERRAAILIGPEYGTVGRQDIVAGAREAVDARFDVLIACAFNFDAHSSELASLGSLKILKARINPDMHMSEELKNTGRGNMFVVFGEPDIEILDKGGPEIRVKVNGVDVFDPNTGDIRSNDTAGIAAWFIDTDYDDESFFVRHAYFLGANDPYKSLKTALQADIDEDAWATLYSDTSRPFERPESGRLAVKVINHFGDEVMKVFRV
jgi:adenine-specific DNA-methyltransferase